MQTVYDSETKENPNPLLEMHSKNYSPKPNPPTSPNTVTSDTHFQDDLTDGKSLERLLVKKLRLNGFTTVEENPRRHAFRIALV
jgi:hypothetical protein